MRKYLMLSLMGVLILVLAACSDDSDVDEQAAEDGGDDDAATEESASGDIVVAMQDDAVSLDPHGSNDSASSQVRQNIYESLLKSGKLLKMMFGTSN